MKNSNFNPKNFLGLKTLSTLEERKIKGGTAGLAETVIKQKQKQRTAAV
ncbi:hypothetical protein [Aquimarina agarivorans]|nr:hypothetical protein [Aquimarina agarivorans]